MMEPAEGPKSNEQPLFPHEFIDSIAENAILGKHASLFGPNTASQQSSPKDAEETFKILQREDPIFKEKIPPFLGMMMFATTSLGRDSQNRIQDFLKDIEQNRAEIHKQTNQLTEGGRKGKIADPDLAADVILAVKATVLKGFLMAQTRFEDATRLFQTMSNTS